MEWLKVKDSEELKQLGTFNEVRRQIKLDGGKHIHITGRSWNELIEAISSFKQKLETLKVNEHPSVEVSKERVNDRVNDSDYFTSLASEYIFYLTELDGQLRMNKLNIKSTHFSDQRQAKSWRDKISKVIHPDLCHHQKASEAMAQLNDLYNQMVGRGLIITVKNELIPYRQGKDLNYTEPVLENQITQKVKSELQRAWRDSILIDEKGWMWVKKNKLHSIIRTNKANAQFLVMRLSSEFKCNFNGELYIRGYKVLELLAKTIEENGAGKKGLNLEASKKFYDAINTCESVRLQRLEYDYTLNEARKKLKKKRRTKYKLTHDELTGEPLIIRSCEFSHIRSQAMYRELSDHIDNGLIVNKETHRLITERGINDENELLSFCKEQGWKTDWYDAYIHKFK